MSHYPGEFGYVILPEQTFRIAGCIWSILFEDGGDEIQQQIAGTIEGYYIDFKFIA